MVEYGVVVEVTWSAVADDCCLVMSDPDLEARDCQSAKDP